MKLHWDILDDKRKSILPLLKNFSKDGFYLVGGTGLALQLGHRDSEDFDFIRKEKFDTLRMKRKLEEIFKEHHIKFTQEEENTVSVDIDHSVKLSFIGNYDYLLLNPTIETEYFNIASEEDIACMKLQAIIGRSVEKDWADLYYILQKTSLQNLLKNCEIKYPTSNKYTVLKALNYFNELKLGGVMYKEGFKLSWKKMQKFFEKIVTEYLRQQQLEEIRKRKEQNRSRDIER